MAQAPIKPKATQKDFLEQLKKRFAADRKLLIQQAVMYGGLAILIFVILVPMMMKIGVMKDDEKKMITTLGGAKTRVKRMPELKQQMESLQKELIADKAGLLQIRELDQLLSELSKIAEKNKVHIVGSRPVDAKFELPAPFNQQYLTASYELTAESGYHNFGHFVNDIENYSKWLIVRELTIQSAQGGAPQKLQSTFQVVAFVQAPQKA